MTGALSTAELDRFAAAGYVAGVPALDATEVHHVRARLMEVYERLEPALQKYFINLHAVFGWADELIRHPRLVGIAQAVLGPDLFVWKTKAFVKFQGNAHVPWHQDLPHWNLEPAHAITVWVALSDVTLDNGCVRVVPGTHHAGSRAAVGADDDSSLLSAGLRFDVTDDEAARAEPMLLRAGEVSVHHGMVVHGSGPNTTDEPRAGIALIYMPAHVRQASTPDHHVVLVSGVDRTGGFYPADPRPSGSIDEQFASAATYFGRLRSGEIAYNVR